MDDSQFEKLKLDLQDTHDHLERLQDKYREQTGKRWLPELRYEPPTCMFCGGKYFHKDSCSRSFREVKNDTTKVENKENHTR